MQHSLAVGIRPLCGELVVAPFFHILSLANIGLALPQVHTLYLLSGHIIRLHALAVGLQPSDAREVRQLKLLTLHLQPVVVHYACICPLSYVVQQVALFHGLQFRVHPLHQHIPPRHSGECLLALVQLRVVALDVCQVVGYYLLRRQAHTTQLIVAIHFLPRRTVGLAPGIPASVGVPRVLRRAVFQRPDIVLRTLLGGRGAEPHKREHLVQPLYVFHQVVLHLQLARHRQPALGQLAEHIAEALLNLLAPRLANHV